VDRHIATTTTNIIVNKLTTTYIHRRQRKVYKIVFQIKLKRKLVLSHYIVPKFKVEERTVSCLKDELMIGDITTEIVGIKIK
jgi:hypothetical protein